MTLPQSFLTAGYTPITDLQNSGRLMISTRGKTGTGKSEFYLSCPGPGVVIVLDRGVDAMTDNPKPPKARRGDFGFKIIEIPVTGQGATAEFYQSYWFNFYTVFMDALKMTEAVTVVVDGDSDSWELQRLAEWGKTTQVPSIYYAGVKAARRAMLNQMWNANKIVVCTNKVKDAWVDRVDELGHKVFDEKGRVIRENSGELTSEGFDHNDYLFSIELEHLYRPKQPAPINPSTGLPYPDFHPKGQPTPPQWGIRIVRCKRDPMKEGDELWGDKCNFAGLVQHVYPEIPVSQWFE